MANNTTALGKRSQEESLRTQQRILDEAERLFAQSGYGGISMRDIAKAANVHHRNIQHHYGSKEALFQTVLNRWDADIEQQLLKAIGNETELEVVITKIADQLFEFMLDKRDWVALIARSAIGIDTPKEGIPNQHSWVQFMNKTLREKKLGALGLDLGLLMITVEGILFNHILAQNHYQHLYGKNIQDRSIKRKTKQHLRKVLYALVRDSNSEAGNK